MVSTSTNATKQVMQMQQQHESQFLSNPKPNCCPTPALHPSLLSLSLQYFAPPALNDKSDDSTVVGHPIRGHGYAIETSLGQKNISNVPSMGTSRKWFDVAPSVACPHHPLQISPRQDQRDNYGMVATVVGTGCHGSGCWYRRWLLWIWLLVSSPPSIPAVLGYK